MTFCAKKMLKMSLRQQVGAQEAWAFALRRQLTTSDFATRHDMLKVRASLSYHIYIYVYMPPRPY